VHTSRTAPGRLGSRSDQSCDSPLDRRLGGFIARERPTSRGGLLIYFCERTPPLICWYSCWYPKRSATKIISNLTGYDIERLSARGRSRAREFQQLVCDNCDWNRIANGRIAHAPNREPATAPVSHQNDLSEPQQTRSNADETRAKSTKLIDSPSLITVWLQVRVLPGPPRFALRATRGAATSRIEGRSVSRVAGAKRKRRRTGAGAQRAKAGALVASYGSASQAGSSDRTRNTSPRCSSPYFSSPRTTDQHLI
jgi:hypothetical protein